MQRRKVSPFSMSFLDIMFCGFGAVVLLVLILNADTVKARNETFADLSADVIRLEQEVLVGQDDLVIARNSVDVTEQERVIAVGEAEQIAETISVLERQIASMKNETAASREDINRLSSDLKTLDSEQKRQSERAIAAAGDKVRTFKGEGDRQYLTGLKVGGKRVLILIDVSASMLDETVVNVVRRRNMDDSKKRNAPKWRRTLATADWLVSNLPSTARFQLYTFNTRARPAISGSDGKWLLASNRKDVDAAVSALRQRVPADGTSLYQALAVAKKLSPRPDNILLVTDGLPTQGSNKPSGTTVSAAERLKHFETASRSLSSGIPVNTILLPMEGDAYAAAAFWKLAIDTRGSFMTPARDWP
ncbi:MAG: VWA domain-containing protein [Gammaproteobacteria bacterium]|jgi:cell division protein FtsB|nr:VWA domain-containing protein [Gammaproteobacteria bacterium]